jgi:hypothetical protein
VCLRAIRAARRCEQLGWSSHLTSFLFAGVRPRPIGSRSRRSLSRPAQLLEVDLLCAGDRAHQVGARDEAGASRAHGLAQPAPQPVPCDGAAVTTPDRITHHGQAVRLGRLAEVHGDRPPPSPAIRARQRAERRFSANPSYDGCHRLIGATSAGAAGSHRQPMTPFKPSRLQDRPACARRHAVAEAVPLRSLARVGLIGSLHVGTPFRGARSATLSAGTGARSSRRTRGCGVVQRSYATAGDDTSRARCVLG